MMRKQHLLFFTLLLWPKLFYPAEPLSLNLEPGPYQTGRQYQLEIKVPEKAGRVQTPQDSRFSIRQVSVGPYRSTHINLNTMQRVVEKAWIYTFILTPQSAGTLELGPFVFTGEQETYRTQPLRLQVLSETPQNYQQRRVEYFMIMHTSPQPAWKNQAVTVEARVYAQQPGDLSIGFQESQKILAHQALIHDISETLQDNPVIPTNINGVMVYYRPVKRYIFFPTGSGDILVQSPIIKAFTPYGIYNVPVENFYVRVRPETAAGLTYRGSLSAELDYKELPVRTGDSVSFSLTLQGTGNLQTLSDPYAAVQVSNISLYRTGAELQALEWDGRSQTFRQTLTYRVTASQAGEYRIPPLSLEYRDMQGRPSHVEIPALNLVFLEQTEGNQSGLQPWDPLDKIYRELYPAHFPGWLWVLVVICLLLPPAGWIWGHHQERLLSDRRYARLAGWSREMQLRLDEYQNLLSRGDNRQAASQAYRLLRDFLVLRYTLDPAARDADLLDAAASHCGDRGLLEDTARALQDWKQAAYAGGAESSTAQNLQLKDLLEKWKKTG